MRRYVSMVCALVLALSVLLVPMTLSVSAATVFYAFSSMTELTPAQKYAADINKDGKVNLYDVARVFYMANGWL